jgi:hypothetical protein
MLAACLLLRVEEAACSGRSTRASVYTLAGISVGLAVAARLNIVLVALVLSVYVGWRARNNRPALAGYMLGGLSVALLLGAYNAYAFGSPFRTGYGAEANDWSTPLWVGLPGILFSPGHGLLMSSPVLLLAVVGAWVVWRQAPEEITGGCSYFTFGRYLSLACLVQLLLMSHWWAWHGGNAYNQRMLQEVHPFLILLLGFALRRYRSSRLFVALLIGAALWAFQLNVARSAFYAPWAERFQSDLVWSLRNAEIVVYVREHGVGGFVAGMLQMLARIVAAGALPSALVWVLASRSGRAHKPVSRGQAVG